MDLLRRDIYCDDLITSVDTEEEAGHVKDRTWDISRCLHGDDEMGPEHHSNCDQEESG